MPYLAVLGRQPKLSLAELSSLYGEAELVLPNIAQLQQPPDLDRLGGTIKIAYVVAKLPRSNLDLTKLLLGCKELITALPNSGKLTIGLSVYGTKLSSKAIMAMGLELKKSLKSSGRIVRLLPPSEGGVSAAQIIHNQNVLDIVVVVSEHILVAITDKVQDIEAYGARDYRKPGRDAKVGMLPPKLAQIMINLANPAPHSTILDPFCGTGVVLVEAGLMGYDVCGSDIERRLIDLATQNLDAAKLTAKLTVADATTATFPLDVGAVVTEGYLGPALEKPPTEHELTRLCQEASDLTLKFLTNLHHQLNRGAAVVMTVPAWKVGNKFEPLQIIDQILALGYTLKVFSPVGQRDLLYSRPDQLVGREIIALTRN